MERQPIAPNPIFDFELNTGVCHCALRIFADPLYFCWVEPGVSKPFEKLHHLGEFRAVSDADTDRASKLFASHVSQFVCMLKYLSVKFRGPTTSRRRM